MLPLIWRYLILEQAKLNFLCCLGTMLLFSLLRIEEIARFAALGAPSKDIIQFAKVVFPQLLLLSIPLSSFISTYLVWQRLSNSSELLGALTSGIDIKHFIFPSFALSLLMGGVNGALALDWVPSSQRQAKELKVYWSHLNPSHLLGKDPIWQLPGATVISNKVKGRLEVYIASFHRKQSSSHFIHIHDLQMSDFDKMNLDESTHLIFYPQDHAQYMSLESIDSSNYSSFLTYSPPPPSKISVTMLPVSIILNQLRDYDSSFLIPKKQFKIEIFRRLYFSFLPLCFSFLAMVLGFHLDRRVKPHHSIGVFCWIMILITSYFLANTQLFSTSLSIGFYLLPSLLVIFWSYRKINQGAVSS
jgi:lipopolysaccharide export system permease protein